MLEIEVVVDAQRTRHVLGPGRHRVGRSERCEVQLLGVTEVSKVHVELSVDANTAHVHDAGSKNGTQLNGEALLGDAPLTVGDELVLGGRVVARVIRQGQNAAVAEVGQVAALTGRLDAWQWAVEGYGRITQRVGAQGRLEALCAEAQQLTGADTVWAMAWSGDPNSRRYSLDHSAMAGPGNDLPDELADARPSNSVVRRVIETGRAAWSLDAQNDRWVNQKSVVALNVRSVGGLPLGRRALLYLSDPRPGRFHDEVQLRLHALCTLVGPLVEAPQPDQAEEFQPLPGLAAVSPSMRELSDRARNFARFRAPILLLGERGTGKSRIARSIHTLSGVEGPFVAVNCTAINEGTAEADLFGSVPGAFTGAIDRKGFVGEAAGGTLFLDEIGDLSLTIQAKLLMLTQEGVYHRVGDTTPRRFTGRIMSATNQPIDDAEQRPDFRRDLYDRLARVTLHVPPLRRRLDDLPVLVAALLDDLKVQEPHLDPGLSASPDLVVALRSLPLEGNVRHLERHLLEAVMAAAAEGATVLGPRHLPSATGIEPSHVEDSSFPERFRDFESAGSGDHGDLVRAYERHLLLVAEAAAGGNQTEARKRLGLSHGAWYRAKKRSGLD